MSIQTCPTMITMMIAVRGRRCLTNRDPPEDVAQVCGEIDERARRYGEEDNSAPMIDGRRNERERETQRCPGRYVVTVSVVTVSESGQRDRRLILDDR